MGAWDLAEEARFLPSAIPTPLDAPGAVLHVITGTGRGSAGKPVLRPLVKRMLKEAGPGLVRDWALTPDDGGYKIKLG